MNEIILRFPRKVGRLSPNSRGHWAPKAKQVKAARELAFAESYKATKGQRVPVFGVCRVEVTIVGGNEIDSDNVVACVKAYIDGLQPCIVANDKHVKRTAGEWRPAQWWEKPHIELKVTEL